MDRFETAGLLAKWAWLRHQVLARGWLIERARTKKLRESKAKLRRRLKGITIERDRCQRKASRSEALTLQRLDKLARWHRTKEATLIQVIAEKDAEIERRRALVPSS